MITFPKSFLLLWLLLVVALTAYAQTPVILSTDIGNEIDDQWAIAYMMVNPDFKVLGVLSAHAPSIPDPAGYNSYLLLRQEIEKHLGMSAHPPIFAGADRPLENNRTPRMNDAVRFLVAQSRGYSPDHRLTIIGIGAATDLASAILTDPSIVNRIRIVAMAFTNSHDAKEYNVQNDVSAWQVLLGSHVPLVIGTGDVCRRDLAMHYDEAKNMLADDGPIGSWLWSEYDAWYYRQVKPLRVHDFTRPWMIWDIITLAYLEGMTQQESAPKPVLTDDLTLSETSNGETVTWIKSVDSARLWESFQTNISAWLRTHSVPVWDPSNP